MATEIHASEADKIIGHAENSVFMFSAYVHTEYC